MTQSSGLAMCMTEVVVKDGKEVLHFWIEQMGGW